MSEKVEQMKKAKKSIQMNLRGLDIYTKFKIVSVSQGRTMRDALREAIIDFFKKYNIT